MESQEPDVKGAANKPAQRSQPARLGGARADFVASLGRKVNDARAVLTALERDPAATGAKAPREELRRKLHALGASARLLRFDGMASALAEAGALLDQPAPAPSDLATVASVLDDLPALAWGEVTHPVRANAANAKESPGSEPPVAAAGEPLVARTALIVGPAMLAEALSDEDGTSGTLFDCERTDDAQAAIDLARGVAPDVMLIDADVEYAAELVEAFLDDPMTEPVPIVVIGAFKTADLAAKFVALGVAKALTKPISAEAVRRACEEAMDQRSGVATTRVTLGEPTLEQLGDRLADEVRRALVESVDGAARACRVPLGEGTEVLGALWGAIARVREVVTARTDGAVRFGTSAGLAPEGAIALAPWLHSEAPAAVPGTDRVSQAVNGRTRGPAADVRLHGRRVIVADDDPGVTWFIADLLRAAGCAVHEALDGAQALDLAYRVSPELVVSDILMPGLDGFALARMLKRDVGLRDTPVILLSWKEDLLQRVRELGASAAAYMRKESDSRAIVARVREVLRPRSRVEARLRVDGEVRGRMDGLTVCSLLELVCTIRPDSRVAVRDASFVYEVEIRGGAPKRVTQIAGDGTARRGPRVLAAMLGVGAGRFTVVTTTEAIGAGDDLLTGTLTEQIARPLAMARAAMSATTGAKTLHVDRVLLDDETLVSYLEATPEPTRGLVERLAAGASPRAMLLGGEVDPLLLEDILCDLAARGAVIGVRGAGDRDVLSAAADALVAAQIATVPPSRTRPPPGVRPRPAAPTPVPASERIAQELPALAGARVPSALGEPLTFSDVPPPMPAEEAPQDFAPSSLADAVMRELSDRSPEIRERSSNPPPIVEPSELRPRSSTPPVLEADREAPSLGPDAIVPSNASGETPPPPQVHGEARGGDFELRVEALDTMPPPAVAQDRTDLDGALAAAAIERSVPVTFDESVDPPITDSPLTPAPASVRASDFEPKTPFAVAAVKTEPLAVKSKPRFLYFIGVAALAGLVFLAVKTSKPAASAAAAGDAPAETPAPTMTGVPVPTHPSGVTYGELPSGLDVPAGQGLLDLVAQPSADVVVDGVARGGGPHLRVPLSAGPHEVRAGDDKGAKPRIIEVRAGYAARIDLSAP